jgi:predicted nuclease of predicted toxin-antitoxin system
VRPKLDENLSRLLAPVLSSLGHDVTTAAEEGLLSRPDTAVAAAAKNDGRLLLTLDLEFGDLRKYPPGAHPGVILFRPRSYGPVTVNRIVGEFIRTNGLELLAGCVAVIDPDRVRVRRPDTVGDELEPS